MRDRLIELLDNITANFRFTAWENTDKIAKYLLANGVLALPVKIGQTIYRMNIYNDAYREATVVAIYYAEDKKYHPKPHILVHHGNERGRLRINFSDFGKTVFLTKEQAEKALERSGNGTSNF